MTDPLTAAEQAALAASGRRRAIAVDVGGIVVALAGAAAIVAAVTILLGGLVTTLLCTGVLGLAAGVAVMRREHSVPELLMPRARRVPAAAADDVETGESYAPARTVADGAPRSPITGM